MSQFRNLSHDERIVVYGVGFSPRVVPPDGVVTVDDDADEAYECQTEMWRKVTAPAKAPATKAAAKTADPPESAD